MDKLGTWAAGAGVAAGLVAAGAATDRRLGSWPVATVAATVGAGSYLAGTFGPRVSLFGQPAKAHRLPGTFALTFDDGPDPRHTPEISALLAERGHRATFFALGRAVRQHPELAARVLADGHELAVHGDDHRLLAFSPPAELRRQLAAAEDAIHTATGQLPARLFRPPHGVRSPWLARTVQNCGYVLCSWNGSVFDTAEPGTAAIAARVERLLEPGAVVLLHDGDGSFANGSRRQTVSALPGILDAAERRGLRSVRLSTLVS